MDIRIVESLLESSSRRKWTIKGEHLCFTDGNVNFLFDKIGDDVSFFGFTKLVLVSNGNLIKMSLLQKMRLSRLVKRKRAETISYMKSDAMQKLMQERNKPATPPVTPPPKPISTREAALMKTYGLGSTTSTTMLDVLREHPSRPETKDDESVVEKVKAVLRGTEKTLNDGKSKNEVFRNKVEKEKLRIRKLLRKGTSDTGPK